MQHVVKTIVNQAVPLQPVEVNRGAEIHLQPVEETHAGAGGCPKEGCDPVGRLRWSSLLVGTCGPVERGAHAEAGFLLRRGVIEQLWWASDIQPRPITTAFEIFEFPLDVKESMCLLLSLSDLLSVVYIMFRVKKEISREVIQRSTLRVDSQEWHGMWEKIGQYLEDFNGLEVHP
ncbi:hypothetical protein BTVI_38934 [Pitangus sulphuratus]|nr:hypothetical protein BTVI_38934 [Pitangus sulphuratus]